MNTTRFQVLVNSIALGSSLITYVGEATAEIKTTFPSQSSDDIDIDQIAKTLNRRLDIMKEALGSDASEVGKQIKQASRMLDEVRSLSDRAFPDVRPIQTSTPRVAPSETATVEHLQRQQAIRLPAGLMNWPMPKARPPGDQTDSVRAFDFTRFDFSALEKSLQFPRFARPKVDHQSQKE